MKPIITVIGPREAGPGDRELMLEAARDGMARLGVEDVTRIDVPGRGSGEETEDSGVRAVVAGAIPALQSGSLFGDRTGLLVVDAHQLLKTEAVILAEIVEVMTPDTPVAAVFVADGAIPAPLGRALKVAGDEVTVARLNERTAGSWLATAARERGVKLPPDAAAALIRRFGSDVGAMSRALDQLAVSGEAVSVELVLDRFKNRPDEPMWHYTDAIVDGNTGEALRRLEDFLLHGHPLQILAALQIDVRRRCLAAAAPDYETFIARDGGPRGFPSEKVWKQRHRARSEDLTKALGALARADVHLKTTPDATHRVTMERLTVALCHWYGGRSR